MLAMATLTFRVVMHYLIIAQAHDQIQNKAIQ